MEKYTRKYLNTVGNKIDISKARNYRYRYYNWDESSTYSTDFLQIAVSDLLEIKKEITSVLGIEYVCFYKVSDILGRYFMISLSELERLGYLMEEGKIKGYKVKKHLPLSAFDIGDTIYNPKMFSECENNPEYFDVIYEETFEEGDYIFIESATSGAMGANNHYAQIVSPNTPSNNGLPTMGHGVKVLLDDGTKWNIGSLEEIKIRKCSSEEFEKHNQLMFGQYSAKVDNNTVSFGCQSFTKSELLTVRRLLGGEIDATITIKNKVLTSKTLNVLISKLS